MRERGQTVNVRDGLLRLDRRVAYFDKDAEVVVDGKRQKRSDASAVSRSRI